jgi:hypothetical protein
MPDESIDPGHVLVFADGPAHEERIITAVPPLGTRWFVQGHELGSDEIQSWWSLEEPPEDETVTVTRYELCVEDSGTPTEDGIQHVFRVAEGTADEAADIIKRGEELLERMRSEGAEIPDEDERIPRSHFRLPDVKAVMVNGEWKEIDGEPTLREVMLEPADSDLKMGLGACVIIKDGGTGQWMAFPPPMIEGWRFTDSTVAMEPEVLSEEEGVVRLNVATPNDDGQVAEMMQKANRVIRIDQDGRKTVIKDRQGDTPR